MAIPPGGVFAACTAARPSPRRGLGRVDRGAEEAPRADRGLAGLRLPALLLAALLREFRQALLPLCRRLGRDLREPAPADAAVTLPDRLGWDPPGDDTTLSARWRSICSVARAIFQSRNSSIFPVKTSSTVSCNALFMKPRAPIQNLFPDKPPMRVTACEVSCAAST